MTRKSIAVRIAGNDYKILSDGDEESLLQIARYVDRAMNDIRERTGTVDTLGVAVLTCLNLARELLAIRDRQSAAVEDDRLRALIDRVERAIEGEEGAGSGDAREHPVGGQVSESPSSSPVGAAAPVSGTGEASCRGEASGTGEASYRGEASDPGEASGAGEDDSTPTLSLPSVESLRERAAARSEDEQKAAEPVSRARVAAGGRERAT